jgi:hypothetical protein
MNSKKVIEQLIKITESQQKIITKLAQQAGLTPDIDLTEGQSPPTAATPPPANKLEPVKTPHIDLLALVLGVNPILKDTVASLTYGASGAINVSFKEGQATQTNYNAVRTAIQQLENARKIQTGHKIHVV